jgi:hypothetical protein
MPPFPPNDYADIERSLNRESENWRPTEAGEMVYGQVIGLTEVDSQYGTSPVVTLLTPDDREVKVHGFGQVLAGLIYGAGLDIGDRVGVKFLGLQTSKSGAQYKSWKLEVRDRDGRPKVTGRLGRVDHSDEPPDVALSGAEPPPPPPADFFQSTLDPRDDEPPL